MPLKNDILSNNTVQQTLFVNDLDSLTQFCETVQNPEVLAIDTEFERRKTYFAKPCLIQVFDGKTVGLIDVLTLSEHNINLKPLIHLFNQGVKLFHAGGQDLQVFAQLFNTIPKPIFDTQVAAAALGYGEQISYDGLVEKILGLKLRKSSRYSDWTQRPLSPEQLSYAADDVIYLFELYQQLHQELSKKDRYSWVQPYFDELQTIENHQPDIDNAWKRLRRRSNDAMFRGRLKILATWREEQAVAKDLPRGHVISDDQLMRYAAGPKNAPDNLKALLKTVVPLPAPPPPLSPEHGAALPLLRLLLSHCSTKHQVAERFIANSDDLVSLARDGAQADIPALKDWRFDVFGRDALALLKGEVSARYNVASREIELVEGG